MENRIEKLQSALLFLGRSLTTNGLSLHSELLQKTLLALHNLHHKLESLCAQEVNTHMTTVVLDFLLDYCDSLGSQPPPTLAKSAKSQRRELTVLASKLDAFLEVLDYAPYVPRTDLFAQPQSHPRWERLKEAAHTYYFQDPARLQRHIQKFVERVTIGKAFFSRGMTSQSKAKQKLSLPFWALVYATSKRRAAKQAALFNADPNLNVAQSLWNALEQPFVKNMMKLVIPSVPRVQKIEVPRIAKHVLGYELEGESRIQVRVLWHAKKLQQRPESLMLHIHGGGFVAMSSSSHQCYTRKWVKMLQMPCLSVDYRLAPEFPYPAALDDVWQVYNWILNFSELELGILPRKVYLVGDSAGGNLALALTLKIIEAGIQLPAGVILAYPALRLARSEFTPSVLLSLEDQLLSYSFLRLVLECYLPNCTEQTHYISPLLATEDLLRGLPPVRVMVGTDDPLHDDCWRLFERVLDVDGDIQLTVFQGMIHGGLNLCYKGGVKEANALLQKVVDWIEELRTR